MKGCSKLWASHRQKSHYFGEDEEVSFRIGVEFSEENRKHR